MTDDLDRPLDDLFAQARTLTPRDLTAAERAWPSLRDVRTRQQRVVWRAWATTLLATAAMLGGILYVRQDAALPTSAAYDTYTSISGSDW